MRINTRQAGATISAVAGFAVTVTIGLTTLWPSGASVAEGTAGHLPKLPGIESGVRDDAHRVRCVAAKHSVAKRVACLDGLLPAGPRVF